MIRNKETGEIVKRYIIETAEAIGANLILQDNDTNKHYQYNSLAEFCEKWEDYKEPKEFYNLMYDGEVNHADEEGTQEVESMKSLGNYFETKEEAEKAVEKLKAWKRLKDKGFEFEGWYGGNRIIHFRITSLDKEGDCLPHFLDDDTANDLDLLFGGEE